ncbi:MAG: DNA polymerase I [Firmicutes bacterium]|nr:DNA polymerase I [Candidatus Fermentithermobacillaceae bacterium]
MSYHWKFSWTLLAGSPRGADGAGAGEGRKVILLVDTHSLARRAFYAVPALRTQSGVPTNAVYGFVNMLLRFLAERKPTHVVAAFDLPGPTFRHKTFAEYKATRKPPPDEFKVQIPLLREVLDALRVPVAEKEGYEADDIIGTLSRKAVEEGFSVLILSGDRDCLQLVSPAISAVVPVKGISDVKEFDPERVREEMGVGPSQIPDLKGLAGDHSDNIPGVKGIGEKTAVELLRRYSNLEGVFEHLDEIGPARVQSLLRNGREIAFLSRELATILRDAPVEQDLERLEWPGMDPEKAAEVFKRLEFHSLISRLKLLPSSVDSGAPHEAEVSPGEVRLEAGRAPQPGSAREVDEGQAPGPVGEPGEAPGPDRQGAERRPFRPALFVEEVPEIHLLRTPGDLERFCDEVRRSRVLSVYSVPEDRETGVPALVGLSDGRKAYLAGDEAVLPDGLRALLEDASIRKVGHDIKWLYVLAMKRGFNVRGEVFDTQVAMYLLDPTRTTYEIGDFSAHEISLEVPPSRYEWPKAERDSRDAVSSHRAHLACGAVASALLVDRLRQRLSEDGLYDLAVEIEFPLIEVLAAMEVAGICVDLETGRDLAKEFESRMRDVEETIYRLAGKRFNIGSPKQLQEVLFEDLKLPPVKKTKTGYSTDAEVLEELSQHHEIADRILEYRQYQKLKSTYLDILPEVVGEDGRIHSTFHQTVTATGRLSSSEPNLQNIPVRGDLGKTIRKIFRAEPGYLLLSADYSQIELRVLAHVSGDPSLIDAFRRKEDIHRRTASEIFGVPLEDVTPELRSRAKAVNFGVVYGISDYGLAKQTGVSREEARRFIDAYFRRYPMVKKYMDEAIEKARTNGYVTTIFGRRRPIPDINAKNRAVRGFAERTAINTPIQGSAADIIKLAMVRIFRRLRKEGFRSKMILQVHDELIFEIPPDERDAMEKMVREEMENVRELSVPLEVDIGVGQTWYEV